MNTLGVAALCFIAGIFLIIIVLAVGASLWVSWQAFKRLKALGDAMEAAQEQREQDFEEFKKVLESAKSVFQGIRSEMSRSLESQSSEMRQTFKVFEDTFTKSLKNLNGKALVEAAPKVISAVKRIEEVTVALHQLVINAEESRSTPSEWQSEARGSEHAPEGTSSVRRSIYEQDRIDEAEAEKEFTEATGGLFS